MSRQPQQNDPDSFLEAMQGVKPLATDNRRAPVTKTASTLAQQLKRKALEQEAEQSFHGLSLELITNLSPYDPLQYKKDGVQHGVYKNLRLGKYQIDTTVNLHSANIEVARDELLESVSASYARGVRCLLLRFGGNKPTKPASQLKSYLQQWLPLIPQVVAFHTALPAQGGIGASYVLLKKNSEQKIENRERHKKR